MPPANHEDCYTSAQVCAAAGISDATLKNWVSRQPQVVLMTAEERRKGVPLLFSFQRAMQIALVAELALLGLEPRAAAVAAVGFTDVGDGGGIGIAGDPREGRQPADLFPEGLTCLFARRDGAGSLPGTCINILPDTTYLDVRSRLHGAGGFVCIEVNPIHARVRAALDAG